MGGSFSWGHGWKRQWVLSHEFSGLTYGRRAGSLVRDDLNALDVASGLEDLTENIFGHTRVESTNVQSPFVRLRGGTARSVAGASSAGRRHDSTRHGRADSSRDGVRVLRDDDRSEGGRRHVLSVALLAIVARRTSGGRWRRQVGARGCRVGHGAAR